MKTVKEVLHLKPPKFLRGKFFSNELKKAYDQTEGGHQTSEDDGMLLDDGT